MWWLLLTALVVSGQLRVIFPPSLQQMFGPKGVHEVQNGIIPASTATFGSPTYGESFVGRLFAINSSLGCDNDYTEELRSRFKFEGHSEDSSRAIFLLRRGQCSFVKKVKVAEDLGADAVVIIDSEDSSWDRIQIQQIILSDDGNGSRVNIPSVLVEKNDGTAMFNSEEIPLITMEWNLPQSSNQNLTIDFWLSSGSFEALKFLASIYPSLQALESSVLFRPHYYILRLPAAETNAASSLCYLSDPTLCAPLPDPYFQNVGSTEIIEENIIQLCILNKKGQKIWWQYVNYIYKTCLSPNMLQGDKDCLYKMAKEILQEDLESCQTEATSLLQNERENNAWGNLALRINGARFSGNLDSQLVVKAVCSAFETQPEACAKLLNSDNASGEADSTTIIDTNSEKHNIRHTITTLLGVSAVLGTFLYCYQSHSNHVLRKQLRQEVMMEVKSQLQDYHRIDEHGIAFSRYTPEGSQRPETEFINFSKNSGY